VDVVLFGGRRVVRCLVSNVDHLEGPQDRLVATLPSIVASGERFGLSALKVANETKDRAAAR
jgi:hypothetical protein